MRITMLGTGAAFVDPDRAQSGILVTLDNGRHYLSDCGAGITRNMVRANVSPANVSTVFLTHLHHDHICDFPLFVLTGWPPAQTFAEAGLGAIGASNWWRMAVPAGTPRAVIERLHSAVCKTLAEPQGRAAMTQLGNLTVCNTPAEMQRQLAEETATWQRTLPTLGVKIE